MKAAQEAGAPNAIFSIRGVAKESKDPDVIASTLSGRPA